MIILYILLILQFSTTLFAEWSTDPSVNNDVVNGTFTFLPVSDSQNGLIVVHQTYPVFPVIYAQHLDVDGNILWPEPAGVRISKSLNEQWLGEYGTSTDRFAIPDGSGGCYIAYQDVIDLGTIPEDYLYQITLYIQRIDSDGNCVFGPDGLELMPEEADSTNHTFYQEMRHWCLDGQGGLYVSWYRRYGNSPENNGTYLARISGGGQFIWGPIKMHIISAEYIPYLDPNLNLNLYYYLGETGSHIPDEFLKVNSETGEIISSKQIEIGVGEWGFNAFYKYCFSEPSSAIFCFKDFRADTLRIQKLDSDGNKLWGEDPIILAPEIWGFDFESDRAGGAYILFEKGAYREQTDTIKVIHLNDQGHCLWKEEFHSTLFAGGENKTISAGSGGDLFVFKKGSPRILAKYGFDGELLWETEATNRDTSATSRYPYDLKADEIGGCIAIWHEISDHFYGVKAQRVNSAGFLGGPVSVISKPEVPLNSPQLQVFPNPFNSSLSIQIDLPYTQLVTLSVYNILGEEIDSIVTSKYMNGKCKIRWPDHSSNNPILPTGVYIIVFQSEHINISKKVLLIR